MPWLMRQSMGSKPSDSNPHTRQQRRLISLSPRWHVEWLEVKILLKAEKTSRSSPSRKNKQSQSKLVSYRRLGFQLHIHGYAKWLRNSENVTLMILSSLHPSANNGLRAFCNAIPI